MRSATPGNLQVEFFTDDPLLKTLLDKVSGFPADSACRVELEAQLFDYLAASARQHAETVSHG